MLAMQYSFTFPADYDMAIIDRRIREKGHLIDNFPGLFLKAYLWSTKSEVSGAAENRYCPFYLWKEPEGLNKFLLGPGFVGLTQAFGWPAVRHWSVLRSVVDEDVKSARHATREIVRIPPYQDLAALERQAVEDVEADLGRKGVVASVAAFEPTQWTMVRLLLWKRAPDQDLASSAERFDVGYVSYGASATL